MYYRTIQEAQANPAIGEINEEPSMTIEGEYMEMKDILKHAMQGMKMPDRGDAQYFAPEDITKINSMYKNSLDLTDIDKLQQQTTFMQDSITAARRKKEQEAAELKAAQEENAKKSEPPKTEE